jgi:2-iminobutanoate/2-iminopropanoate deaminase
MEPELRQAIANLRALLDANGATLGDVVKVTVFLTDMGKFGAMNDVYVDEFGGHRPARSAVGVAALPVGAAIELEAWAWIGAD